MIIPKATIIALTDAMSYRSYELDKATREGIPKFIVL